MARSTLGGAGLEIDGRDGLTFPSSQPYEKS